MGSSLFLRFYLGVSGSLSGGDVMFEFLVGSFIGAVVAVLIMTTMIEKERTACEQKNNVFACERQWVPKIQKQN